jgi:hypothetical protein
MMLQPVLKPVLFGLKTDEDAGGLPMLPDEYVLNGDTGA